VLELQVWLAEIHAFLIQLAVIDLLLEPLEVLINELVDVLHHLFGGIPAPLLLWHPLERQNRVCHVRYAAGGLAKRLQLLQPLFVDVSKGRLRLFDSRNRRGKIPLAVDLHLPCILGDYGALGGLLIRGACCSLDFGLLSANRRGDLVGVGFGSLDFYGLDLDFLLEDRDVLLRLLELVEPVAGVWRMAPVSAQVSERATNLLCAWWMIWFRFAELRQSARTLQK